MTNILEHNLELLITFVSSLWCRSAFFEGVWQIWRFAAMSRWPCSLFVLFCTDALCIPFFLFLWKHYYQQNAEWRFAYCIVQYISVSLQLWSIVRLDGFKFCFSEGTLVEDNYTYFNKEGRLWLLILPRLEKVI